jgi:hypothetical protein
MFCEAMIRQKTRRHEWRKMNASGFQSPLPENHRPSRWSPPSRHGGHPAIRHIVGRRAHAVPPSHLPEADRVAYLSNRLPRCRACMQARPLPSTSCRPDEDRWACPKPAHAARRTKGWFRACPKTNRTSKMEGASRRSPTVIREWPRKSEKRTAQDPCTRFSHCAFEGRTSPSGRKPPLSFRSASTLSRVVWPNRHIVWPSPDVKGPFLSLRLWLTPSTPALPADDNIAHRSWTYPPPSRTEGD